jgi:adenosylmethionine-8-amino-7-oxononanoate aminotransferase
VVAAARDRGLLLYWSTGCADGTNGDLVMLGPPLVASDAEVDEMADLTATAIEEVTPT